ncbi:MAG: DUF2007 domain-containing protein [Chloroflexi bacterium]|nr:DUF2007 domain-containing protein [Chloroflexota bacterium]
MPEKLQVVYRALGEAEAQIIKDRLESEGIPALLRFEAGGPVPGGSLGGVEILVPAESASRARRLLSAEPPPDPLP